jgi:crossover junction endodeoxyribonuclease RuvC
MAIISLGVDPGLAGAIAVFDGRSLVAVLDMPTREKRVGKKKRGEVDGYALAHSIHDLGLVAQAFFEEVGARPGQGVTSMNSFGRGMGRAEGVLMAFEIDLIPIYPQAWTSKMNVWDKEHSCKIAARQWPRFHDLFLEHGSKAQRGGRADAALIGLYGLTHWRK